LKRAFSQSSNSLGEQGKRKMAIRHGNKSFRDHLFFLYSTLPSVTVGGEEDDALSLRDCVADQELLTFSSSNSLLPSLPLDMLFMQSNGWTCLANQTRKINKMMATPTDIDFSFTASSRAVIFIKSSRKKWNLLLRKDPREKEYPSNTAIQQN